MRALENYGETMFGNQSSHPAYQDAPTSNDIFDPPTAVLTSVFQNPSTTSLSPESTRIIADLRSQGYPLPYMRSDADVVAELRRI